MPSGLVDSSPLFLSRLRCHGHHPHSRRPRAQSQERRSGDPSGSSGGHHRRVGLGKVVSGFRHPLCRRPTSLCGVPLRLRPSVSSADGEARCGRHRGALPRDLHRAEVGLQESPLDRRHGNRDPRLPASAVRLHRGSPLCQLWQGDSAADGAADGGPRHGSASQIPVGAPRTFRAGQEGRVSQAAGTDGAGGLCPRPHRRRNRRAAGGNSRSRQTQEARHRHRRGSVGGQGWHRRTPVQLHRDRSEGQRRLDRLGTAGDGRGDTFTELRLYGLWHQSGGDHTSPLLLQQSLWSLLVVLGLGYPHGCGSGPGDRRSGAGHLGRGSGSLDRKLQILVADADAQHLGERAGLLSGYPVEQATGSGTAGRSHG